MIYIYHTNNIVIYMYYSTGTALVLRFLNFYILQNLLQFLNDFVISEIYFNLWNLLEFYYQTVDIYRVKGMKCRQRV